ncbi:MAG TPA: hypothetical protein VF990_16105 [Candidatus Dormibacteraeota bacterium]
MESPGDDAQAAAANICVLCRVTVMPLGKRLCYRCWRMMPPAERRRIMGDRRERPSWVDTGIDKVD